MELHTWLVYFLAALGLSLSPGPNGLLALTHGALHGRNRTLFTVAGGAVGFTAIIALSMFGIGALLQTSLLWLTVLKWVGGAYLVWLGIQVWRAPPIAALELRPGAVRAGGWTLFRQGALSAMTNPKGILFFAAFLPQFIDPAADVSRQLWILAITFVALATLNATLYAAFAGSAARLLSSGRAQRRFKLAGGSLLSVAGVWALLARRAA